MHAHGATHLSYQANVRKVCLFIGALWICVSAFNVPTMLAHTTKNIYNFTYCGIENRWIAPIFLSFSAFGYAVPLIVIGVIYVTIARFLRTERPTTIDQQRARERTSKVCRVIALVVIVFGVSWLPYHVNIILAYFGRIPDSLFYEVQTYCPLSRHITRLLPAAPSHTCCTFPSRATRLRQAVECGDRRRSTLESKVK